MSSTFNVNSIETIFPELEKLGDIKCAEIYSTSESNFFIICTFCYKKFFKLKPFAIHVRENHLNQSSLKVYNKNNPQLKSENITKVISSDDDHIKDNQLSDSIEKNDKILPVLKTSKTLYSKPIKIVIKSFKSEEKKNPSKEEEKNINCQYIKCGFGGCKQMFPNQESIDRHKTEIHSTDPNYPYKCKDCTKTFTRISNVDAHVRRAHLKERRYKCDYCDKRFFERTCKTKHQRIHTGEKPCICEKCGESFSVTHKLNMHVRSKHELPQLQCTVCNKLFHNKENLTLHMICHRKEMPYQCKICSKRFPRPHSLRKHLTTHASDRDFVCRLCGKDFTSKVRITCHMKSHGLSYMEANVLRKSKQEKFEPYEVENFGM